MRYLLASLLLFSFYFSFSQDSPADSVQTDTVIIYKDPLRIKKTVFVDEAIQKVKPTLWLSGFGGLFGNFNYYASCDCYQTYFSDLRHATSTKMGNMEGLSFSYLYKRLYAEASVFFTNYREGFKYDSAGSYSTTNAYHYTSFSISPGYLLINKKVRVIASAGYVLNHLNSYNGLTLSLATKTAVDINGERKFYTYTSGGIASLKFLYTLYKRLDGIIDVFYMADLHSVTPSGQPFMLQRNTVGVKAGLGLRF